jgi:type II secretory pathway component PulJ
MIQGSKFTFRKSQKIGGRSAFTLMEIILAVFIVLTLVLIVKRFIDVAAMNSKYTEETSRIDSGLHALLTQLRTDLECIVLIDKKQPIFEIVRQSNAKSAALFFFTSNSSSHVTVAVKYDIGDLGFCRTEIRRTTLSAKESLKLQGAWNGEISMEKLFDAADQRAKEVNKFSVPLSDFKIRAAIKKRDGRIEFAGPNTTMTYSGGRLVHKKGGSVCELIGDLLFFDVTARALCKADMPKFERLMAKDLQLARDFMFSYSRRSFARITFNSETFL